MRKLYIGSDHAGFELKKTLISLSTDFEWVDLGTHSKDSVDYPDLADQVCRRLIKDIETDSKEFHQAVLICGSGVGMSMRANRFPKIRAALCHDVDSAVLTRQHNDANILVLGARVIDADRAFKILTAFTETTFEGGRHLARVAKLEKSTDTP